MYLHKYRKCNSDINQAVRTATEDDQTDEGFKKFYLRILIGKIGLSMTHYIGKCVQNMSNTMTMFKIFSSIFCDVLSKPNNMM